MEITAQLLERFAGRSTAENLLELCYLFPGQVSFSTSFGAEDQVITHLIHEAGASVQMFTLDTGRLFPETYTTWTATLERYSLPIRAFYPDEHEIQEWVTRNGPNAFYETAELRKSCCHIRKVEPLKRALEGQKIWITGIRAAQSPDREGMPLLEWDSSHQLIKYHPLLHWSNADVNNFIRLNSVPVNPLHDRGFVSIGCAPCTRAIKPGEDFRAGRWWWESNTAKECGLHQDLGLRSQD